MVNFIHIGMPKALSSVLQKDFFFNNQDIYFLGVGNESLIDYIDDDVNFLFETLLLYARESFYTENSDFYKTVVTSHKKEAERMNKKAFGASLEWIAFNFTPDMTDRSTRIKRMAEFFDSDTKIILIIRNQMDLIKSLYGQFVKEGLSVTYTKFINYILNYKERNFYCDLFYDEQYEKLSLSFNKNNIYFLPLEEYRGNNKILLEKDGELLLIKKISEILEVNYPKNFKLNRINDSLNNKELFQKLELNRKYQHDFGNYIFEPANIHRSRKNIEKQGSFGEMDLFKDVKIKRLLLQQAKQIALTDNRQIDWYADTDALKILQEKFSKSNHALSELLQVKLPDSYYSASNY